MKPINRVIKILVFSDLILISGFGLVAPIFAIYITDQIRGGDVKVAGFAAAIYWILKSIAQIPVALALDRHKGEKDDFWCLIFGSLFTALVPLGYLVSSLPWHIYGLQALYALGMATAIPAWAAIFTRHIDKGREALEWSLDSTAIGVGAGITGAIGGLLVSRFGFDFVFVLVSVLVVLGALLPLFIYKTMFPKGKITLKIPKKPL